MLKVINGLLAVIGGVGGVMLLFWSLNWVVEKLPPGWESRLKPYVFIGPAMLAVTIFIIYPGIRTVLLSFFSANSEEFVGVQNYAELAQDPNLRSALFNNFLWILFVPTVSVALGLVVAVLADRLSPRSEKIAKSVIFLPMAISFVGASTIWKFIYEWRPAGQPQIGVLNAIWTGLGGQPQTWLQISTVRVNTFLLMIILMWLQAGFAMVLLSAAIKGVPDETLEAARIDGATEVQIFWRVIVPQIASTIVVVLTTIVILVLKVFDIVYVMTGGNFNTDVVANRFITELFNFRQFGRAAAIVVALIIATIPIMIYNIRTFRAGESR
jgi:alpha-glucoside transport system permease protein